VPVARPRPGTSGPKPRPRRRRRGPIALLLVLLLAAGLSFAAWFYAAGPGATDPVPNLVSLSVAQAKDKAAEEGFTAKVTGRDYDEVIPVGSVVRTDPGRGDKLKSGGQIGLITSRGPLRYDVPPLAGRTETEARQILEDNHLVVGEPTKDFSDTVPEGSVISSIPDAGTSLKPGAEVSLVLSKGVEPVPVPDVTNQDLADAKAALKDVGLRGKVADEQYDDAVAKGAVISQTPKDGKAAKDSVVELVVSKGPPLVDVPDVVGKSIGEARAILEAAGFKISSFGPGFGTVRGQNPRGGTAPKGSTIRIVYL
jgi:beta-lactam-binding protein with PASTA domain